MLAAQRGAGLLRLLLALAVLAAQRGATAQLSRTPDDIKASADALKVKNEQCPDVDLSGVDREGGRKALKAWLGDGENIVLKILKNSRNTDALKKELEETITPMWLVGTAGALIFSFILGIVWLFCCWTACPFCRCCLCCRRTRKASLKIKFVLMVFLGLLILGMVIAAMFALRGRNKIDAGLSSVGCTAGKTMYHTLNGATGFIGMLPMMDQLNTIKSSLLDGSTFISDVQNIMTQTKQLERAQYVATQTMSLLEASLNDNNRPPVDSGIGPLLTAVSQVNAALQAGQGQAMANARAEVNRQLSSANRQTLRASVDSAVAPLRSAADVVRDSLWFFIKDDWMDILDLATSVSNTGTISIACLVFLVAACGLTSGFCYTFMEFSAASEKAGGNPWNPNVHRCSLATWCCGWGYMFLVFFIAGTMVLCYVPMASGCLVMDDLSGRTVKEILPALGSNTVGDDFDMVANLADMCFSRSAAPGQSLLDAVYIRENGVKVSLATKLRDQLVTQISSQFATVNQRLGQGASIANDPGVVQLKQALTNFAVPPGVGSVLLYKCPLFESSAGSLTPWCDVRGMTRVGSRYTNDCVIGTSPLRMERRAKVCTSAQFEAYMNQWADRIDKVLLNLDLAVANMGTKISQDLQRIVDRIVTTPVNNILAQASCDFLRLNYMDFVAGFCFEGVLGFGLVASSYIANGVLTLLTVIVAYGLWRVSLDNRWKHQNQVRPMYIGEEEPR